MAEMSFDEIIRRSVELTPLQRRMLFTATSSGYYDFPRKVSLSGLAAMLGVKPSTASEILRAAERRVMQKFAYAMGPSAVGRPRHP